MFIELYKDHVAFVEFGLRLEMRKFVEARDAFLAAPPRVDFLEHPLGGAIPVFRSSNELIRPWIEPARPQDIGARQWPTSRVTNPLGGANRLSNLDELYRLGFISGSQHGETTTEWGTDLSYSALGHQTHPDLIATV